MKRHSTPWRAGFEPRLKELGIWPQDNNPYYDESAHYSFTEAQVETLYEATTELERMVHEAIEHVVKHQRFDELGIAPQLAAYATSSWARKDPTLYGRMDLAYDGIHPPKLLEYNADTPTALFEAAVLQWEWLEETKAGSDQFNSIHEELIRYWTFLRDVSGYKRLTLAGMFGEDDDRITLAYMEDVAHQAGWVTVPTELSELGFDGTSFRDSEGEAVAALFKLYPWDWLAQESFFAPLITLDLPVIEAPWRVIPASKGLLPILWELFPDHPNLLAASFSPDSLTGPKVSKPVFGREGADVAFHGVDGAPDPVKGDYDHQPMVWQAYAPLPVFDDGWRPVIGSWIVGGVACGIGIREDHSLVTGHGAKFRPHCMEG
jgi:glutathionylspermidine synthase